MGLETTVEVDAHWTGNTGSSYGLIFGIQGDFEHFYSFEVNTDYEGFGLYRYGPEGWTEIIPFNSGLSMINPGTEINHLKVTRNGDTIMLEINGTLISPFPQDGIITGLSVAGLIVSSYSDLENAEASFDNFRFTRLEPSSNSAAEPDAMMDKQVLANRNQKAFQQENRR